MHVRARYGRGYICLPEMTREKEERGRARRGGNFNANSPRERKNRRGKTAPGMRQGDCALNAESLMILMKVAI